MKNIRLFGIVLMLFALGMFLSSYSRAAAEAPTPRLITVTGDADVKVVPDEVVFMIGVETWDKDLNLAQSQNDERVKKILALTKEMAIDPKYVQTDRISVEPRYRDGYTRADFVGFFVRKSIVITLKDTDKFEALQTGALNAGATHIHGVQYRTTELRKYRDEARALAIKAAQEKATALAAELKQKVGQPNSIREDYSGWWSPYNYWWGSGFGGGMAQNVVQNSSSGALPTDGTISLGQITVNAKVTVSFELE